MFLLYIFVVGALFITCFRAYSNRFYNEFDCEMYFAPPGVGKTLTLAHLEHTLTKRGWRTYSTDENIGTRHVKPEMLGKVRFDPEYKNALIVDEASLLWHNRNYKTFSEDLKVFFKKHRHEKVKIILASQSFSDVDKVIRQVCDRYYLLERRFGLWVVAKRIRKEIALTEAIGEQGGTIAEQYIFEPLTAYHSRFYTYIPKWCKRVNSFELTGFEHLPLVDDLISCSALNQPTNNASTEI